MNRTIILFFLPAAITMEMVGCATYDNKAMAGAAVDKKPSMQVVTPSPASNTLNRENLSPVAGSSRQEDTIIQIGDDLEVIVAEDRTFDGIYEVRMGGYFILPAVGRIQAAGLPLKIIQANVTKALEETQLPHATVKVNKLGETHSGRQR